MKIFALTCGRRNANAEILVKEALLGAQEKGAEVEFVRMLDMEIHNCAVCWPCPSMMKGIEHCIYKDDGAWLYNKLMDCDGFLLAAPCYALTPPGQLLAIRDRIMGPRVDVASNRMAKEAAGVDPKFEAHGKMVIDDRIFRQKVGAMISIGGATTENWVSLCLATMQTLMFPAQFHVADQMNITGIAEDGAVTLHQDLLERARQLGRNMVDSFQSDAERKPYLGDMQEICPTCHQGLMMMKPGSTTVECAVCGIKGTVSIDDAGKLSVTFKDEDIKDSRQFVRGLELHNQEVFDVSLALEPDMPKLPGNRAKYREYDKMFYATPPSKDKKAKAEV